MGLLIAGLISVCLIGVAFRLYAKKVLCKADCALFSGWATFLATFFIITFLTSLNPCGLITQKTEVNGNYYFKLQKKDESSVIVQVTKADYEMREVGDKYDGERWQIYGDDKTEVEFDDITVVN